MPGSLVPLCQYCILFMSQLVLFFKSICFSDILDDCPPKAITSRKKSLWEKGLEGTSLTSCSCLIKVGSTSDQRLAGDQVKLNSYLQRAAQQHIRNFHPAAKNTSGVQFYVLSHSQRLRPRPEGAGCTKYFVIGEKTGLIFSTRFSGSHRGNIFL